MKKLLVVIVVFLCGCGSGEKLVEVHHVGQAVIDQLAGTTSTARGYAKWEDDEPYNKCDIYVLSPQQYLDHQWYHFDVEYGEMVRVTYHYALGHETEHCFSGSYHD